MVKRYYDKLYSKYNAFKFKKAKISIGKKFRIRGYVKIMIAQNSTVSFGDNFLMLSGGMFNALGRNIASCIRVDKGAVLQVGNNVGMSCVSIWSSKKIIIKDNAKLGADVMVLDSDMHSLNFQQRRDVKTDAPNAKKETIQIGKDVFVGTRSIITKGVTIGNRSIIAAGSVVVKNIPSDEVWGGNPAKFIKRLN